MHCHRLIIPKHRPAFAAFPSYGLIEDEGGRHAGDCADPHILAAILTVLQYGHAVALPHTAVFPSVCVRVFMLVCVDACMYTLP